MKKLVFSLFIIISGCSDKSVTPSDVKQAYEACIKNSTWKSIAVNGDHLWIVCVDDVPMNVERIFKKPE